MQSVPRRGAICDVVLPALPSFPAPALRKQNPTRNSISWTPYPPKNKPKTRHEAEARKQGPNPALSQHADTTLQTRSPNPQRKTQFSPRTRGSRTNPKTQLCYGFELLEPMTLKVPKVRLGYVYVYIYIYGHPPP